MYCELLEVGEVFCIDPPEPANGRKKGQTEALFACLYLECSSLFHEMGPLRRHMKQGHLNKWSLRLKQIRASIINVETQER